MTAVGVVMLLLGGAIAILGAWSAATRSRPAWMPGRTLPPETARGWGMATALGGVGAVIWGANLVWLRNPTVQLVAALLVLAGAAWVSALWPRSRPRR